ncbi:MAG TPA: CcoQ/FixQ family Cbb3-type cytochrome c oxidase assembly chaperone [Burkholderiales bacterium]
MNAELAHGLWTLLLLLIFLGIVLWAWSGRRKPRFEQAARLALDDEPRAHAAPQHPRTARHAAGEQEHG